MFRPMTGFKATCGPLTLFAVSEFDEWKIVAHDSAGATILGTRQFTEAKAKEHAQALAQHYLAEELSTGVPAPEIEWNPTGPRDFLLWRA